MGIDSAHEERAYLVSGEDENGDFEMFASGDLGRADARYRDMCRRLKNVRRNYDWSSAVGDPT